MATTLDLSLNRGSDTVGDCTICSVTNYTGEAEKLCVECNEYLCTQCIVNHNQWPANRNHQLLPAYEHASSTLQGLTEMCHLHGSSEMLIDTYCEDHDDMCCSKCAGLYHSSCHKESILVLSKGIKHSDEFKDVLAATETVLDKLRLAKDENELHKSIISKVRSADINEIQHARKVIREHFDQIETDCMEMVSAMLKEREQAVNQRASELETLNASISDSRDGLKNAATEYDGSLFVKIKRAQMINKKTDASVTKLMEEVKTASSSTFELDKTVLTKTKEILSFGQIVQGDHAFITSLYGDYTMKLDQDSNECDITGACFMDDGTILMVDRNNEKLKQSDQDFNFISYDTIPGKPYDVCKTDNANTVAVTVMDEKKIQYVFVHNKTMKQGVSFRVFDRCRGIAYNAGELFVSCGGSLNEGNGVIAVHTVCGVFLRQIGATHLQIPIHIVFAIGSGNGDSMYVTDSKLGAVIMLDTEGNFLGKFTDPSIREAKGLCVTHSTRVLVTGKRSNNVMQFDTADEAKSRMQGLVGKDGGIVRPCSLLFDAKTMRLIVTMSGNSIKVFSLSYK